MSVNRHLIIGLLSLFFFQQSYGQNFTNKGKDFWVAYGYSQRMLYNDYGDLEPANNQNMVLYFTSDKFSVVTVTIPGIGLVRTYNVPPDTVILSDTMPKIGPEDIRLTSASTAPENKGIHITATEPVIAYSHIYADALSGASLLFPTPTLSKEYYSVNYTNNAMIPGANGWFYVIAVDTGITTVEITPKEDAIGHPANVPFTVTLTQGQVYNVMGIVATDPIPHYTGSDLTGSLIKSIATSTGPCKKIAVFSGSGAFYAVCNGPGTEPPSQDNFMVQALPKNAWGKKYVTSPIVRYGIPNATTSTPKQYSFYRICVQDPTTIVKIDGVPIGFSLQKNFYYQLTPTYLPMLIEADKPILVAMYFSSRESRCDPTKADEGDTEVIYLSPVEQSINKTIWNATSFSSADPWYQYVNIVIPNTGTAISSFRLDGNPVPPSTFETHPSAPDYSYAIIRVNSVWRFVGPGIQHRIESDSGFNAIAYGYGTVESYGFVTGLNFKDRYQYINLQNQFAQIQSTPSTCKNTPFELSVVFPYQPTQIKWLFYGLFTDVTINSPAHDSTWVTDGRQLYRYTLPLSYSVATPGSYPIKVIAQNPIPGDCSGIQELEFEIEVFERPKAGFDFSNICFTSPVAFTDTSNTFGSPAYLWNWDFGDGNTSNANNPSHTYTAGGSYTVNFSLVTEVGCVSDTATTILNLADAPLADFNTANPRCENQSVTFNDMSSPVAGSTIVKWTWDFGDGSPVVVDLTGTAQTHTYTIAGTYDVTLTVETNTGCSSLLKTKQVVINKKPLPGFISPEACTRDLLALFTDTSTAPPETIVAWQWHFGDPFATAGNPNTSNLQNPTHHFTVAQSYTTKLIVTSSAGCIDSVENTFLINGDIVDAAFTVEGTNTQCSNTNITIRDGSGVDIGNIVKVEVLWDATDPTIRTVDDDPIQGKTYTHLYPEFYSPATRNVTITYIAYSGTACVGSTTQTITLHAVPQLQFDALAPVCMDAPAYQLPAAAVLNAMTGTGTYSGPGVTASGFFDPATAGDGLHTIRYTFTGANTCSNFVETTILVYPSPLADAGPDKLVLQGSAVMLTPQVNSSLTYSWSPPTGLSATNIPNPLASPTDDLTYVLTVTNNNGCKDTSQVFVKVLKPIKIPNIFSPNGDGVHDTWVIGRLEDYPGSVISIFNRYGQLVHKIDNYSVPWDGKINGRHAPVGTYYYIIEPKNGRSTMSGYVDVIR